MAEVEKKDVSDSLGDSSGTHQEGVDYIKSKLEDKDATATEGTVAPTSELETTTKPEPITAPQPPASNPGAEDPTAGIAKDAGGVSGAAHVQSPTATKEKRKSIVGQLTGFLGIGGKKEKEARNAGEGNSTTGTASSTAATAAASTAATATALADRTKSAVQDTTGVDMGAKKTETANTDGAGDATKAEETPAGETTGEPPKQQTDTSGEDEHKPPKPADPSQMENRSAIPVAGGEKLGEKHWGESKIVPENPKPVEEETPAGVASKDGQPSKEVSDNTAKNTGGATSGPSGSKSPDGEKKEKFFDKIKGKLSKKDKS